MELKWIDLKTRRQQYTDEAAKHGKTFTTKTYSGDAVGIEPDKGDYVATVSTDSPDADGEVLPTGLIDLSRFQKVMAVHLDHNLEGLPIGRAKWIKSTDHSLIAKYFVSQATPETRAIDYMLREGVLHMHSISFMGPKSQTPNKADLSAHPDWKGSKVFRDPQLMIEFSVVGQPANDDCDMLAIGKRFGLEKTSIDRLTGKTAETIKVAAEAVADLQTQPAKPTEAEVWKAIGKRLEQVTNNIDYDRVRLAAMKILGK